MKRILLLIIFFTITFNLSAQINSFSVQGIDCYNDTGFIALDVIPGSVIQWEYKNPANPVGIWENIANYFPLIWSNNLGDTIWTTNCFRYKATVGFDDGTGLINEIDSFFMPCSVTIGQGQENILCYGDSSGILRRPVFGGAPFDPNNSIVLNDTLDGDEYYTYTWYYADDSLGTNSFVFSDTTWTLDSLSQGWYKTIVTDAVGCTDTVGYINLTNPQLLIIDTTFIKDIDCRGTSTGSIEFEIYGGKKINTNNKYFYYLILYGDTVVFSDSTGSSSNFLHSSISLNMQSYFKDSIQINDLIAGNYVLAVVDSNSCIMKAMFNIIEPLPYATFASTTYPLICESDSGYLKIDSVLGGGNIQYGFTGQNTDSIYVPSGWYQMYIEDLDFNCIDTVSVRCYAQYEIEVFNTIINNSCFGSASGVVVIDSIIGGNTPYDVQWGGLNSNALEANTYSVLIVDSIGCVHAEEFTVTQPNQIDPNSVLLPPSCYGASDGSITINLLGGTGSLSYYWLNGTGTADSLYGLFSGIYTLVVSDSLLCVDSFDFSLADPDSLNISFSNFQDSLACYGEVIVLNLLISGGTAPFSILWNDGDTNQQRIIGAGNYSCTVTDVNGCIATESFVILEPESLSINLTYSEITCDEGAAASISISGGVDPINVIWSTGETLTSIDSLWGTIYWVVVTDSCGNSASDTFEIFPYVFETSVFYDDSTHIGEIKIDTCSSLGTFTYQWVDILSNVISNNNLTSHLCEGTYFVTTNDNTTNCSVTDTLTATYYLPNGIVDETITTVFPDLNLWGNPPYSYFWDNGEILAHADICPGAHWVEVTDNDGCIVRVDFDIDPLLITLDPAEFIIECNLENLDVDINADVAGGTAPYTYAWSNGNTENSINLSLNPGNYTITVMDNNACTEDTSFVIATMSADCVPNVFTPNGDNINDTWNLENTFLYSDSEIRVYGRYGKLLFQSVGYSTPWDGKNENGNDVTEGAYFYHIEIGHDFDAIKGSVTIIR